MRAKRILISTCIVATVFGMAAGCSGGGSATNDQMEAARDAQAKSMESQKKARDTNRGASSIDAASKAGSKAPTGAGN